VLYRKQKIKKRFPKKQTLLKLKKNRVDILLQKNGLCSTIEEARKKIMAGLVRIGADFVVRNSSDMFYENTFFSIDKPCRYVSRGAFKLLPAVDKYLPNFAGRRAVDIGASTGGFTDLMLQKGAIKVYAVDVGQGQLHLRLRQDPRVVCMEKINARYFKEDSIPEKVDVLTMDVSFISVTKILPAANKVLLSHSWAFILIKPQFEAERSHVERGGVVRDKNVINDCIFKVQSFVEKELGWSRLDVMKSPILGPKGNQEHILVKLP
jgi:23S rRNA (cytidine1920-2'-O)/16S rRNA (cytidine1409-2'-O)-methyltransferase